MVKWKQVEGFVRKQKNIVSSTKTRGEKIAAFGFWAGVLNGFKMTGAITFEKYKNLFEELENFGEILNINGFSDKLIQSESMERELWIGFLSGLKTTRAIAEERYKILIQNIKDRQRIA